MDKKLFIVSKKVTLPRYYKHFLHRCINAWVGAYCEGILTGGSWINTETNWHINVLKLNPCF